MKALFLSICLVLSTVPAVAQSAEAMKYADRPIALLSDDASEGVMPLVVTTNGQRHLEFVPASKIEEAVKNGGQSIRLGDVLSALNDATQTINKLEAQNAALQAENEKLWQVAMKNTSQPALPAPAVPIVIQQAPQQPSRLEQYMLLRSFLPAPTQNLNVTVSDCTRLPALCAGR